MPPRPDPSRDLLAGLLALQHGLVGPAQLIAAFRAWCRDEGPSLAELLMTRGSLDAPGLSSLQELVAGYLSGQGGEIGDGSTSATIAYPGPEDDPGRRPAPTDGRRYRVIRPHARGG